MNKKWRELSDEVLRMWLRVVVESIFWTKNVLMKINPEKAEEMLRELERMADRIVKELYRRKVMRE